MDNDSCVCVGCVCMQTTVSHLDKGKATVLAKIGTQDVTLLLSNAASLPDER